MLSTAGHRATCYPLASPAGTHPLASRRASRSSRRPCWPPGRAPEPRRARAARRRASWRCSGLSDAWSAERRRPLTDWPGRPAGGLAGALAAARRDATATWRSRHATPRHAALPPAATLIPAYEQFVLPAPLLGKAPARRRPRGPGQTVKTILGEREFRAFERGSLKKDCYRWMMAVRVLLTVSRSTLTFGIDRNSISPVLKNKRTKTKKKLGPKTWFGRHAKCERDSSLGSGAWSLGAPGGPEARARELAERE